MCVINIITVSTILISVSITVVSVVKMNFEKTTTKVFYAFCLMNKSMDFRGEMASGNVSLRRTKQNKYSARIEMNNSMTVIIRVSGEHLRDIVNDHHDILTIY